VLVLHQQQQQKQQRQLIPTLLLLSQLYSHSGLKLSCPWSSDSLRVTQAGLKGSCIGRNWIVAGVTVGEVLIICGASTEGFVARMPCFGAA